MSFTRPLCRTERVYLVYDECCPGFANQFILEGSGVLDLPKWRKAVEIASAANPGSRLVLKGSLMFSRWVDSGVTPRVREVDGSSWDGLGPENAPAFLTESLSPWDGPTCEVVLVHGDPLRIVFRSHHAVMDGRGNLTWLEDIIRALNGLDPLGSNSKITELGMCKSFQKEGRTPPPHEFIAPTGMPQGNEAGVVWRRVRFPGRYKDQLGQLAVLLAQYAWKQGPGKVRFGIPVDLRARQEGLRSTGNLTNLIYLDMTPELTYKDISQNIARQLAERKDGMLWWGDEMTRFVPLWLIRRSIHKEIKTRNRTGRYRNSGILSNMGRIPVQYFAGAGFQGNYIWGIPPGNESVPIFVGLTHTKEDQTLIFSMPKTLGSGGRLEALIDYVQKGFVASES